MSKPLAKIIATKGWCLADGATGTNLFGRGLDTDYPTELWSVERPAVMLYSLQGILTRADDIPIVAKGNCGIPAYLDGAIHYHGAPELMAEYALFERDAGAKIIGGCCGTTPSHVAAMVAAFNSIAKQPFDPAAMTAALGTAWNGVGGSVGGNALRGGRRGRRR